MSAASLTPPTPPPALQGARRQPAASAGEDGGRGHVSGPGGVRPGKLQSGCGAAVPAPLPHGGHRGQRRAGESSSKGEEKETRGGLSQNRCLFILRWNGTETSHSCFFLLTTVKPRPQPLSFKSNFHSTCSMKRAPQHQGLSPLFLFSPPLARSLCVLEKPQ